MVGLLFRREGQRETPARADRSGRLVEAEVSGQITSARLRCQKRASLWLFQVRSRALVPLPKGKLPSACHPSGLKAREPDLGLSRSTP